VDSEGLIEDNDALVFIDFRADRMRQIVETLGVKKNFECKTERANLYVAGMTQYNASFNLPALFPPQSSVNVLAEWLSKQNKTQFHTAETEKYAHVTFFFNGGREDSFPGEDRQLISSPKVATYDLQPEMSAAGVAEALVAAMAKGTYDFTMCNLAPPDMVGHTGKFDETVIACTATDVAIKTILDGCIEHGYILVITSDHGNAEEMLTAEGNVKTAHSSNPVPLNIATPTSLGVTVGLDVAVVPKAGLQDVAPTVLALMGIDIPVEMTGKSVVTVA
jgi:2,3-bisphosphoglycerate-independent phosphoglycerate mutase